MMKLRFDVLGRADPFGARSRNGVRTPALLPTVIMNTRSEIPQSVELYIGTTIEYASERRVLKSLLQLLNVNGMPSIIFANFNLGDRQLDFVVATEQWVLVIEVKGFTRPIRGEKNGRWQLQVGSDDWKPVQNAYLQALQGSLRLRDAMRASCRHDVPYPKAAVVFAPSIPEGSTVPRGDFKVSIGDLTLLDDLSAFSTQVSLSLAQWRQFAKANGLERVTSVEAAIDSKVTEAELALSGYTDAFRDTYRLESPGLVPFVCNAGDQQISAQDLETNGVSHPGITVLGPSGCGKSLLAQAIAVRAIEDGVVPLFIEAKYFSGEIGPLVEQEVALLGAQSVRHLFSACRTLERPLLLIVDGFNECLKSERHRLARCIKAVSRRYEATVIVTAQKALDSLSRLRLPKLAVPEPSLDVKRAIAGLAERNVAGAPIEVLLEVARSGLEASLVGEVGRSLPTGASRFALFDAYVRRRLGKNASEGIRALALMAGDLTQRVSFSTSIRDFDRLMQQNSVPSSVSEQLFSKSLLDRHSDRASFAHEMYLNAFGAESVVRAAAGDTSTVAAALRKPIHRNRRTLIVGAIDDYGTLSALLGSIEDADVVVSCVDGECGAFVKQWVERRFRDILASMIEEARSIEFQIGAASWFDTEPRANTLTEWNVGDEAFVDALPELLCRGLYLDEVFIAVGAMDHSLVRAFEHLHDEVQEKGMALQASLFGAAYVFGGIPAAAITRVCSSAHSRIGFQSRRMTDELLKNRLEYWICRELSPGQLYVWLRLATQATRDDVISDVLPSLIEKYWPSAPYHLRLDLLNAAYFCGRAPESRRRKIIEVLEMLSPIKNVALSSTLIDALGSLGALAEDAEAHDQNVEREISQCLATPNDESVFPGAAANYFAQFDHPYASAYSRVISELPAGDRHQFLVMALRGVDDLTMFLPCLIGEVAEFDDPIDGEWIRRWTAVPPRNYFAPQDAVSAFVISHLALGRLGVELGTPASNDDTTAATAWAACGQLLYWTNRADLAWAQRLEACADTWGVLLGRGADCSLDAIRHVESGNVFDRYERLPGREPVRRSIVRSFPEEVAGLCRHALNDPDNQQTYFTWPNVREVLAFAISVLGEVGRSSDVLMLRQLVDDECFGETAVTAIRKLEDKLSKTV